MSELLYLVRGVLLGLAWLLLVNALASAVVALAAQRLRAIDRLRAPEFWLALRLVPAGASTAFVVFVFAPSYWKYEPRLPSESFDVTVIACALAGAALLVAAGARGFAAWRSASRRTREWSRRSRPIAIDAAPLPAFAVDAAAPTMALAGVFRARLLITRGVLDTLTDEELRAAVAHELGHWRSWDNLKRLAMRAAPDLLRFTPAAAAIESRWASAAEHAADHDACGDARSRCALASALVKVARLTLPATPLAEPISTLVDGGEIASRVERLLSGAAPFGHTRRRWPLVAGSLVAAGAYVPLLQLVHDVTEVIVHVLP